MFKVMKGEKPTTKMTTQQGSHSDFDGEIRNNKQALKINAKGRSLVRKQKRRGKKNSKTNPK